MMFFKGCEKLRYRVAASCHIGLKRENNEDNFYVNGRFLSLNEMESSLVISRTDEDAMQFYAIFDGMGGEEHGETAALIAAETLAKYQDLLKTIRYHDLDKYIDMYISEANNRICEAAESLFASRMGTTMALLCIRENTICLYNIGDSRIYKSDKKGLKQLSQDHTAAFRAVEMGMMTAEEAKLHPHRHKLTQYLGVPESELIVKPHRMQIKAGKDEQYLLCSDGLTDMAADEKIRSILKNVPDPEKAVKELISSALENGGRDNICVILLKTETAV